MIAWISWGVYAAGFLFAWWHIGSYAAWASMSTYRGTPDVGFGAFVDAVLATVWPLALPAVFLLGHYQDAQAWRQLHVPPRFREQANQARDAYIRELERKAGIR